MNIVFVFSFIQVLNVLTLESRGSESNRRPWGNHQVLLSSIRLPEACRFRLTILDSVYCITFQHYVSLLEVYNMFVVRKWTLGFQSVQPNGYLLGSGYPTHILSIEHHLTCYDQFLPNFWMCWLGPALLEFVAICVQNARSP